MPQTPLGLTYPDKDAHTRLWEHFETLAGDVDTALAPPAGSCFVTNNVSTTQPNGTWYTLVGLSGEHAQNGMAAGSSGLIAPRDGIYLVTLTQRMRHASATVVNAAAVYNATSAQRMIEGYAQAQSGHNVTCSAVALLRLSANDNIRIQCYGTGQEATIYGGNLQSRLSAVWVGP